jgi:ribosome-binding ATPase YchF (GTP1/OBG family)
VVGRQSILLAALLGGAQGSQLLEAGSLVEARNKGWLRSEGKEYGVQEGDSMEFLFNV